MEAKDFPQLPGGTAPPMYQVATVMRQIIRSGAFAEGALLPSEPAIAKRYGLTRPPIHRALELVAAEGLIARTQQPQGWRVTYQSLPAFARGAVRGAVTGLTAACADQDWSAVHDVVETLRRLLPTEQHLAVPT